MGLILDSSVLIAGERRGNSVENILYHAKAAHGDGQAKGECESPFAFA